MDFQLTPEQEEFQIAVRRFAERNLKAGALERAHSAEFQWNVLKQMADQGLLGITIKEDEGGQGGTLMDAVLAIEAVASVCPKSADLIQMGNFGAVRFLAEFGTHYQKERYLAPILRGESVISVGMTEAEAGSAVTDLVSSATPDGDGFRINGGKVFAGHTQDLDVMLAYVRFGPGVGGIGSVLLDTKSEGFRVGKRAKFMSGEEWAQVY